ncbi:MAG TPA: NAD(P)H-binding protein [Candidatus Binataceae bacterium]|nr:NAD(P)H-binding protein [Candidatus Binataceae bacterium]
MASSDRLCVVTGAFGYTGRHIARMLLDRGWRVRTLTNHPRTPDPFGGAVEIRPLHFSRRDELQSSLRGADTLINTYWVRFAWGGETHESAVAHTKMLIEAAREAGVRRLVHVSITNPSADSDLPYFRGKGQLEEFIRNAGISYAILRPTVLFGQDDILINNIAWVLRHFPVFGMPGRGDYQMQPVFVEDFAALAVESIGGSSDVAIDAVGPETYSFAELLRMLKRILASHCVILPFPPIVALAAARAIGALLGDVMLTADEVKGLMRNLLISSRPPSCSTRLSEWLQQNADSVGVNYASELARRRH